MCYVRYGNIIKSIEAPLLTLFYSYSFLTFDEWVVLTFCPFPIAFQTHV